MHRRAVFAALAIVVVAARFCHVKILWVEEAYPMAAAIQLLHGKALYRDVIFDKPPLSPLFYLLFGAWPGWPLRVAGSVFVIACAYAIYRFGKDAWGEFEGLAAAVLLVFSLTFWIPSAVMALAPDALMILPHIVAVWLAWRGKAFASGIVCGLALATNAKGVFVLAACALWCYKEGPKLMAGFAIPTAATLAWFGRDYVDQVWTWGLQYSAATFVTHPIREGLMRTGNWAGFHAILVLGLIALYVHVNKGEDDGRGRIAGWIVLSMIAVCGGLRFFPRYYFHLLPPMCLAAARGIALMPRYRGFAFALLLIPMLRFGPRYVTLAGDMAQGREHQWMDLAMSQDSEAAAAIVSASAGPGDTILAWGYRPDVLARTRLPLGTRLLDSQAVTGVLADRHLTTAEAQIGGLEANRAAFAAAAPTVIVDGLAIYNPALAVGKYRAMDGYRQAGRTGHTIVYRRAAK